MREICFKKVLKNVLIILMMILCFSKLFDVVSVSANVDELTISLIGDETIYYTLGTEYQEIGAIAQDPIDGDISKSIIIDSSTVNTNKTGTYSVKYRITNSLSETKEIIRTVVVSDFIEKNTKSFIYYSNSSTNVWNNIINTSDGGKVYIGTQYYYYSYYGYTNYECLYIIKEKSDGTILWSRSYSLGNNVYVRGWDAVETSDGSIIAIATNDSNAKTIILLFDTEGNNNSSITINNYYRNIEKVSDDNFILLLDNDTNSCLRVNYDNGNIIVNELPFSSTINTSNAFVCNGYIYTNYNNKIIKIDINDGMIVDETEDSIYHRFVVSNDGIYGYCIKKIQKLSFDFEIIWNTEIDNTIDQYYYMYADDNYFYYYSNSQIYYYLSDTGEFDDVIRTNTSFNTCKGLKSFDGTEYVYGNYSSSAYYETINRKIVFDGFVDKNTNINESIDYSENIQLSGNIKTWYIQKIDSSLVDIDKTGIYQVFYYLKVIDDDGIKTVISNKKFIVGYSINIEDGMEYLGSVEIIYNGPECMVDDVLVNSGDAYTIPGQHVLKIVGNNEYIDTINFSIIPVIEGVTDGMVTYDNVSINSTTDNILLDGEKYDVNSIISSKGIHNVEIYQSYYEVENDSYYPYSIKNGVVSSTNYQASYTTSNYQIVAKEKMILSFEYKFTYENGYGYSSLSIYKNGERLVQTYDTSEYKKMNISLDAGDYVRFSTYNYNSSYRGRSYIRIFNYYEKYIFTIEPTILGVEDLCVYDTTIIPNINAENMTLNGNVYNNEAIDNCGYYDLIINGTNGYTKKISFTIETTVSNLINDSIYEGSVKPAFTKGTALLDGSDYVSNTVINVPGNHELIINGEGGYSIRYNFTVNLLVNNIVNSEVYYGKVKPIISGGDITLNDAAYVSGTEINVPGNYKLEIKGVNDFSETFYFIIRPEIVNVENGKTYYESLIPCVSNGSITLDGNQYVSGTLLKESGQHELMIIGEGGYYENIKFTLATGANVDNGNSYIDEKTLQFVGDGILDGNEIDAGYIVNTIGKHILELHDGEHIFNYEFYIEPDYSMFDSEIFGSASLVYKNALSVKLDGNTYTSGTIIKNIGDHTIIIKGVNGYEKEINFMINPKISIIDGESYYCFKEISIEGAFQSAFIDEEEYEDVIVIDEIGKHKIIINDNLEYTFYIIPSIENIENCGYYFESVKPIISGGYITLDGEEFESDTLIDSIGNHTIVISGKNDYKQTIKFIILPNDFTIKPNEHYNVQVSVDNFDYSLFIDEENYTFGTIYDNYGKHVLKIQYDDVYSFYDFYIIPNVEGVVNSEIYNKSVTINTEWNYLTIDGNTYTSGNVYEVTGYHTLILHDIDGYDHKIEFTICEEITGVDDLGVYNGSISINVNNGNLYLDDVGYTNGSIIKKVGNHQFKVVGTNGYEHTISFTIKEQLSGIENGGVYSSSVSVICANCDLLLNNAPYTSGNSINTVGTNELTIIGTGDYSSSYTFTIEPTIYIYINGIGSVPFEDNAIYPTNYHGNSGYIYLKIENVQLILLNGEQYENQQRFTEVGLYNVTIYGLNNYEKVFHFTKDAYFTGIVADGDYTNSQLTITCENVDFLKLNDELYISSTTIEKDGNYVFSIYGLNGYEKHVQFTKRYPINGVADNETYVGYTTIVNPYVEWYLDGENYISGTPIKEIGNHTIWFEGEDGYSEEYNFTISPYLKGISEGGVYSAVNGVQVRLLDKKEGNNVLLDSDKYSEILIDDEVYDNYSNYYMIGNHTLKILGKDYEYSLNFKIIPSVSINDNYNGVANPNINLGLNEYSFDSKNWVYEDGVYKSNKIPNSSSTKMTITANTNCTITFEYKTSTEMCDIFKIIKNNVTINTFSKNDDYLSYNLSIEKNDIVELVYEKDSGGVAGDDCVYIKNLIITPVNSSMSHNDVKVLLDDEQYIIGTSINQVGKHTIKISGANNYLDIYEFTIKPIIQNINNGSSYSGNVTPIIDNAILLLDNKEYNSGDIINEVGNHTLEVRGSNGYIYPSTISFTIKPIIQNINNGSSYVGSVTPIIDNAILLLDNKEYNSGDVINEIGNHNLVIKGSNGYTYPSTISFTIKPEIIDKYKNQTFEQVKIDDLGNADFYLDDVMYDCSNITSIGNHSFKIIGTNNYEESFSFTIKRDSYCAITSDGRLLFNNQFECYNYVKFDISGASLLIDDNEYINKTDYKVIGIHYLSIIGTNGYSERYKFTIKEDIEGLENEKEYDEITIYCPNSTLVLNGESIDNLETISDYGRYQLRVEGSNGYLSAYNFDIRLKCDGVIDGAEYEIGEVIIPLINSKDVLINTIPYESGKKIDTIGNNQLVINGAGGLNSQINFKIRPKIMGISDNQSYLGRQRVIISGLLSSISLNNEVVPNDFVANKIGHNVLKLCGVNGYEEIVIFTIEPVVSGIIDGGIYNDSVDFNVEDVYDKLLLNENDITYNTDNSISYVGNYILEIHGIGGYTKEYSFTIEPQLINAPDGVVKDTYFPHFNGDGQYFLNENEYDLGTKITTIGRNIIKVQGVNSYEKLFEIIIEPTLDFGDNTEFIDCFEKKLPEGTTIDNVLPQLLSNGNVKINRIGNHVVTINGVNNYTKDYNIVIHTSNVLDEYDGYAQFNIDCERIMIDDQLYKGDYYYKAGYHVLNVYGSNGYTKEYRFLLNAIIEGTKDDGVYEKEACFSTNNGIIKIDGIPINNGSNYNKVGIHKLTIDGRDSYQFTYNFTINDCLQSPIDASNNTYFDKYVLNVINSCDKIMLDGNEIQNNYIIDEIGNHEIKIIGRNNYEKIYNIIILPTISFVDNGGEYLEYAKWKIDGKADIFLDDEIVPSNSFTNVVGNHELIIQSDYDYYKKIVFSVLPKVTGVMENGVYYDSIVISVPNAVLEIDNESYLSGNEYRIIGNHTLSIIGSNGFTDAIAFTIIEGIIIQNDGHYKAVTINNLDNCEFVMLDGIELGETIKKEFNVTMPGKHSLILKGKNGYQNQYDFYIEIDNNIIQNGVYSIGDNIKVDQNIEIVLNGKNVKDLNSVKTVGNNRVALKGTNGYTEEYEFEITSGYELLISNNAVYKYGLELNEIDATVIVDGTTIEFDENGSYFLEKSGEHKISVVGVNGYLEEYNVTIVNPNITYAIMACSIVGVILIGTVIFIIIRKRVI